MGRTALACVFRRFWRGLYTLPVSFWSFGILAGGTCVLLERAENAALDRLGFDPRRILAVFAGAAALRLLVEIVAMVGIWRSASRAAVENQEAGRSAAWPNLAKAVVVLAAAHVVAVTAADTVPSLAELTRIALRDDPSVPPYTLALDKDGTTLRIDGGIKFGLVDRFLAVAKGAPRLRTVALAGPGGRLGEAERLRAAVRARGLDTLVSGLCVSACTVAFAGGRHRWLAPQGRLGFHAPSFRGEALAAGAPGVGAELERQVFAEAGFRPAFIGKALATPPAQVWEPAPDELMAANVVTGFAGPHKVAATGE